MSNPDDPKPPYRQVADKLRTAISEGHLKIGDQLPTYERLASEYDVSIGTAKSALGVLRSEELITTVHGKGSFVRAAPDERYAATSDDKLAEIQVRLDDLTQRLEAVERHLPAS